MVIRSSQVLISICPRPSGVRLLPSDSRQTQADLPLLTHSLTPSLNHSITLSLTHSSFLTPQVLSLIITPHLERKSTIRRYNANPPHGLAGPRRCHHSHWARIPVGHCHEEGLSVLARLKKETKKEALPEATRNDSRPPSPWNRGAVGLRRASTPSEPVGLREPGEGGMDLRSSDAPRQDTIPRPHTTPRISAWKKQTPGIGRGSRASFFYLRSTLARECVLPSGPRYHTVRHAWNAARLFWVVRMRGGCVLSRQAGSV